MKNQHSKSFFSLITIFFLLFSCSHQPLETRIIVATQKVGILKNNLASFPIYLTETSINRSELEKIYSKDIYIIHLGHILKPQLSKIENEKILEDLSAQGINLINLCYEDFIVAEAQGIKFENYKQDFLNSSVLDLETDNPAAAKNITPYKINRETAFIGLSDRNIDQSLFLEKSKEKFIVDDYVLSVLRVKNNEPKDDQQLDILSFIIIHKLGNEISEVMERLPINYTNTKK